MSDTALIERIKNKDHQAFKELFNKFRTKVFNTCMGFLHNKDDAEDITQEVFIEVYQSIEKFRSESKLSTWLYRIAVNKSLNFIRDNKKAQWIKSIESFFTGERKQELHVADDIGSQPEKLIENTEKAKLLHNAINSLSKNQKIAFTLNKYEDMSYKQISEIMDLSLSSVESLIHRARINLQKKLLNYYKKNL